MNVLGWVTPGQTIYLPWNTFNAAGASVTLTGLAVGDIKIYKNGSTTERSSTSGYALLDTDGIDFDGMTGIHGISINLADNTDAGFYTAGAHYVVAVSTVTVDGQTVSFVAGTFRIGYANARLNTTIATLYSQNIFDLAAGPAHANALSGVELIIHGADSATQFTSVVVNTYSSGRGVVLSSATTPAFTIEAGDNVAVMGPAALTPSSRGYSATVDTSGRVTVGSMAADSINAAALASDAGTELATAVRASLATELARIDAAVSTRSTPSNAVTLAAGSIDAIWAKAMSDLASMPDYNASVLAAINAMFQELRNVKVQTGTTQAVKRNDATTNCWTRTVTPTTTTVTVGEAG